MSPRNICRRALLILITLGLALAAGATPVKKDPIVLLTGWGTPEGFDKDYAAMADFLDGAKDDFTLVIGTQAKRTPDEAMPVHPRAVSPAVYVGPYRTLFNAPATIVLPYHAALVTTPERIRPYVFNEITRAYEPVPRVLDGQPARIDTTAEHVSFQVQALGQFVLVEETDKGSLAATHGQR